MRSVPSARTSTEHFTRVSALMPRTSPSADCIPVLSCWGGERGPERSRDLPEFAQLVNSSAGTVSWKNTRVLLYSHMTLLTPAGGFSTPSKSPAPAGCPKFSSILTLMEVSADPLLPRPPLQMPTDQLEAEVPTPSPPIRSFVGTAHGTQDNSLPTR